VDLPVSDEAGSLWKVQGHIDGPWLWMSGFALPSHMRLTSCNRTFPRISYRSLDTKRLRFVWATYLARPWRLPRVHREHGESLQRIGCQSL